MSGLHRCLQRPEREWHAEVRGTAEEGGAEVCEGRGGHGRPTGPEFSGSTRRAYEPLGGLTTGERERAGHK